MSKPSFRSGPLWPVSDSERLPRFVRQDRAGKFASGICRPGAVSVLAVGLALVLGACSQTQAATDIVDGQEVDSFFPVQDRPLALVSMGEQLSLTDGINIESTIIRTRRTPNDSDNLYAGWTLAARADDSLVVLGLENLAVIDLQTGSVASRSCADCHGVGVIDEAIFTIRTNGELLRFNSELDLQESVNISELTKNAVEPPEWAGAGYYDWDPKFEVADLGTDDVVVASYPEWGGTRYGPTQLTRFDTSGGLLGGRLLDGRYHSAHGSESSSDWALLTDSSSGACWSGFQLHDVKGENSVSLLKSSQEPAEARVVTDWSWNGDDVLAVHYGNTGGGASDCNRFDWIVQNDGASSPQHWTQASPGLLQVRVLDGCERVLQVRRGSDELTRLFSIDSGSVTELGRVDHIVWSDTSQESCGDAEVLMRGTPR